MRSTECRSSSQWKLMIDHNCMSSRECYDHDVTAILRWNLACCIASATHVFCPRTLTSCLPVRSRYPVFRPVHRMCTIVSCFQMRRLTCSISCYYCVYLLYCELLLPRGISIVVCCIESSLPPGISMDGYVCNNACNIVGNIAEKRFSRCR